MNSLAASLVRLRKIFASRRSLKADNVKQRIEDIERRQSRMLTLLADFNDRLKLLERQGIPLLRTATDPLLTTLPAIKTPLPPLKSAPVNNRIHLIGDHNAIALYAHWSTPKPKLQAVTDQTLGGLITALDFFGLEDCHSVVICISGYPDGTAVEILESVVGLLRSTIWAANDRVQIIWYLPNPQYIEHTMNPELEKFVRAKVIADNAIETSEDIADELKNLAESGHAN